MNRLSLFCWAASVAFGMTAWDGHSGEFAKRRAALVEKYDGNNDGLLNRAEREAMLEKGKIRPPVSWMVDDLRWPPEFLAKYDRNGDGDMDRGDWGAASRAEMKAAMERYDKNRNGKLDDKEKGRLRSDLDNRVIKEPYSFLVDDLLGGRGRGGGGKEGFVAVQGRILKFDANRDGIADPAELVLARQARSEDKREGSKR